VLFPLENRNCPIHWLMTCKTSKLQIPSVIKRSSNFMKSCQSVKDVNIEATGVLCEAGRVQNISNVCSMETPECLKISLHNSIDHPSQPYERIVGSKHFSSEIKMGEKS